jgi:hypothetical protein
VQLADDRSHGRTAANAGQVLGIKAALALKRVVSGGGADERADENELVGGSGKLWKVLANVDARQAGGNRLELAANLSRSVGLEIDHVHLRRAAVEMDIDDGFFG